MQKFLITGALVMALTAPAFAPASAQGMAGPSQPTGGMAAQTGSGMSGGMAHDGMAMGKHKPKKPKHDAMSGGAMSGPAQTGGGMAGGMSGPNH